MPLCHHHYYLVVAASWLSFHNNNNNNYSSNHSTAEALCDHEDKISCSCAATPRSNHHTIRNETAALNVFRYTLKNDRFAANYYYYEELCRGGGGGHARILVRWDGVEVQRDTMRS